MEEKLKTLLSAAHEAVTQLNDARTGTDFECDCWELAERLENALDAFEKTQAK